MTGIRASLSSFAGQPVHTVLTFKLNTDSVVESSTQNPV
jgi:hypothetical protein